MKRLTAIVSHPTVPSPAVGMGKVVVIALVTGEFLMQNKILIQNHICYYC